MELGLSHKNGSLAPFSLPLSLLFFIFSFLYFLSLFTQQTFPYKSFLNNKKLTLIIKNLEVSKKVELKE